MKRRLFLSTVATMAATVGASSALFAKGMLGHSTLNHWIVSHMLKREFQATPIAADILDTFITLHIEHNPLEPDRLTAYSSVILLGSMAPDLAQRSFRNKQRQVAQRFLLSTNLANSADQLKFVRYYDPYASVCSHPFAHLG